MCQFISKDFIELDFIKAFFHVKDLKFLHERGTLSGILHDQD